MCDKCGGKLYQREDDNPVTQQRRIKVYQEQTAPLDAYYRERGVLVDIDGEQSPAECGCPDQASCRGHSVAVDRIGQRL